MATDSRQIDDCPQFDLRCVPDTDDNWSTNRKTVFLLDVLRYTLCDDGSAYDLFENQF